MPTSRPCPDLSNSRVSALDLLAAFVEQRRAAREPAPDFEVFEEEVRRLVAAVESLPTNSAEMA